MTQTQQTQTQPTQYQMELFYVPDLKYTDFVIVILIVQMNPKIVIVMPVIRVVNQFLVTEHSKNLSRLL